ncbi:hypothetical protein OHA25_08635 [Nonomuraea sp. NBC_00507]|uniref:hypothetical protein n=1 Tax=Nonomuraea sp. NBC_00507 TaxID=2976002 RepID=UPI002E178DEE
MADSRIIVAIEFVNGARHQAACRTQNCTAVFDSGRWRGGAHSTREAADLEARGHRDWHRSQREQVVAGA